MKRIFQATAFAAVVLALAGSPRAAWAELNILYYGNSFTNATCCGGSRSVPAVVSDIAVAAGHPAPFQHNAAVNGQALSWHLLNNTAAIDSEIASGDDWDIVVLQDYSTSPTRLGNLSVHLSSTLAMYQQVATRSPGVRAVMYETWARGPSHSYYTGGSPAFPGGPAEMQAELRDGYLQSTANINATAGDGVALYAPAGDAWQAAGFASNLYAGDIYHANNRGSLLNALVLYGTIYGDTTTSDIDLSGVLSSLGLSTADGQTLTAAADSVLVPEPTSLVLAALGLAAMANPRRRTALV
ncbi:hypothetical protein Mal64_34910 [Pseudobythopirellula maris]|uniref:Ice-binding protein C-terminal domain-containing protein n=1 Tax=Pseudobythopirellula maris TaxID=2527991 RepID=A0A5C5ZH48_9BACT|nr:PEP-CTERM sorting domain-containing protein [Pseudobythopirellula maris]TWT86662.1 hypothetical protein Mal64_34910 [Pseudobythopirellula maris]